MDRDTFFRHLRRSRLLSEQELAEAARLTSSDRAKVIARALVDRGVLTRFQAGRLLAGKAGRLLLGQYRILNQLGRGGTGVVFKAVHAAMERVVAIKVILPGFLKDNSALGLFTREVRAAAGLHHPNIVTAYDANTIKGVRFLVMEYVDGPSLQDFVKGHGPLPVGLACELMRQAADALQYAHERGMVHRDIKPANLLITLRADPGGPGGPADTQAGSSDPAQGPVVKVVDFGLARVRGTGKAGTIMAEPGVLCGTVDYISPEQAENIHAVDIRSDLYSLGCTFYHTLTGQVPFPGGTAMEKLVNHFMHEPRDVRDLRPEVPAAVADIVRRLMAKDRDRRFRTPAELAQELAPWSGPGSQPATAEGTRVGVHPTLPNEGPGGCGAGPILGGPADDEQPTVRSLPQCAVLTPPVAEEFRDKFRRWTTIIESIVCRRGPLRRIDPEAFSVLQQALVAACEQQASSAEGARQEFYQRLAEILKPWLHPKALTQADLEVRYQLLHQCRQVEQDLDRWVLESRVPTGQTTFVGVVMAQVKKWRDQFGL